MRTFLRTLLVSVLLLSAMLAASSAEAREYTVLMVPSSDASHPYRFSPSKLAIEKGDTVKWVNEQNVAHDVMFESVPKGADFVMSPMLAKKGQSWSYTFSTEGTYEYHCHPHESVGMRGTIVVGHASRSSDMQKNMHDD